MRRPLLTEEEKRQKVAAYKRAWRARKKAEAAKAKAEPKPEPKTLSDITRTVLIRDGHAYAMRPSDHEERYHAEELGKYGPAPEELPETRTPEELDILRRNVLKVLGGGKVMEPIVFPAVFIASEALLTKRELKKLLKTAAGNFPEGCMLSVYRTGTTYLAVPEEAVPYGVASGAFPGTPEMEER